MEVSTNSIKKGIVRILHRFHIVIFALVVAGGLAIVVILLNGIIRQSGDASSYTSATSDTGFDESTVKRLGELKTREEPATPLDFSNGRNNPFIE
jgi:hypothetical protein